MYAILGATGKLGGAAIRSLQSRGLPVRAIVREKSRAQQLKLGEGGEVALADICDSDRLQAALRGADRILVICPMNPRENNALADHQRKIRAIAEALERVKPEFVIAISDYGAHYESGTGIAGTFHSLERRLRLIPMSCTVLRSAEHMQNWGRFLGKAQKTGAVPLFYRPATRIVPYVSAMDVGVIAAEMLADSRRESREVVHVEGPRRYSMEDVVKTMAAVIGAPVQGREIPQELWVPALMEGGLSESYARLVSEMYAAHNAGRIDIDPNSPSARRATTSLAEAFESLFKAGEE